MNAFQVEVPNQTFDIRLCVHSGQVFRWELLPDGRLLGVDGRHWYVVRESGPRLEVESNALLDDFVDLFRLDWDVEQIRQQVTEAAPEIAPYLSSLHGLRLMKPSDPVETFYSFLCTPNNNIARITGMVRHLASHGPSLGEWNGKTLHRFPGSEVIARIPEQDLRARAFGYRAATITGAAVQILELGGDAWIEGLKQRSYEEAFESLIAIRGIGPKLADCIALFALHHTEAAPVDTHIWQAATRLYFPEWKGKAVTDQRYRAVGKLLRDRLGSLTGWVQQFLFVDNMMNWRSRR